MPPKKEEKGFFDDFWGSEQLKIARDLEQRERMIEYQQKMNRKIEKQNMERKI